MVNIENSVVQKVKGEVQKIIERYDQDVVEVVRIVEEERGNIRLTGTVDLVKSSRSVLIGK